MNRLWEWQSESNGLQPDPDKFCFWSQCCWKDMEVLLSSIQTNFKKSCSLKAKRMQVFLLDQVPSLTSGLWTQEKVSSAQYRHMQTLKLHPGQDTFLVLEDNMNKFQLDFHWNWEKKRWSMVFKLNSSTLRGIAAMENVLFLWFWCVLSLLFRRPWQPGYVLSGVRVCLRAPG